MSFEIKRLISEEKHKQQNRIVIGLKSKQHIIQNKVTIKSNQTTYACLKRMPRWRHLVWGRKKSKNNRDSVLSQNQNTKHWGSVLGPILFVIYINDMPDHVDSEAYLFADDTKVYNEIKTQTDTKSLQKDLDNLQEWSDKWLLKFQPKQVQGNDSV